MSRIDAFDFERVDAKYLRYRITSPNLPQGAAYAVAFSAEAAEEIVNALNTGRQEPPEPALTIEFMERHQRAIVRWVMHGDLPDG